jgi:ketosteroid isomerase-like protein
MAQDVDDDAQSPTDKSPAPDANPANSREPDVDEFLKRFKQDLHRPKPTQDAVAAALHAMQQLESEVDVEHVTAVAEAQETKQCKACGAQNPSSNRFCSFCGVAFAKLQTTDKVELPEKREAKERVSAANEKDKTRSVVPNTSGSEDTAWHEADEIRGDLRQADQIQADEIQAERDLESFRADHSIIPAMSPQEAQIATPPGQHHYHHHYHHHYFPAGEAGYAAGSDARIANPAPPLREPSRARPSILGASLSRAETAVRKLMQDWAQACNTKQLDDLVSLYGTDALVLRPNLPAVRGAAAIREFFFALLDGGLGDVEIEPLRTEVSGDIAYEAGRCSMLVPVAVSKRREERGKYLTVFARTAGEWKIVTDSWSSDLGFAAVENTSGKSSSPAAAKAVSSAKSKNSS